MRSYKFDVNRIVNQLTPHYLKGRKFVLLLQSLLSPLCSISDKWASWAYETRMEAAMTSQVILFTHFLSYKFKKYFSDPSQSVMITEGTTNGVLFYHQDTEAHVVHPSFYYASEKSGEDPVLKWYGESDRISECSFIVSFPKINTELVSLKELSGLVSFYIDRYKLAGKKYIITYN